MTWKVRGYRPVQSGHGEIEKLIKVKNKSIPCVIYIGECVENPELSEKLAQIIAEGLNRG